MNTPITDAVETKRMDTDIPVVFGTVPSHVARRLELDRSALMKAVDILTLVIGLTPVKSNLEALQEAYDQGRTALAAARANFPTP